MITGEMLRSVPLFHGLPDGERNTIASHSADIQASVGDWIVREGETSSFFVLIEGALAVFKTVGGHDQQVNAYKPGDFFGEIPLLLGSAAVASFRATAPSRLMRLSADDFGQLISKCPILNAEILKVMATRVGMLQQFAVKRALAAVTVTGPRSDAACHTMRDFLMRNHVAFRWIEPDAAYSSGTSWPVVSIAERESLTGPSLREVADKIGLQTRPLQPAYDVVVAGGGPAGLAAAVYGASEGLKTLLIERTAPGGQAGTSSRIENYLGFPTGVSGDELSLRARDQAARFGAELLVTRDAAAITVGADGSYQLGLDGGDTVRTSAVVLATGVEWRELNVPGMNQFLGRGVYYGAAQTEALAMRGQSVYIVGGGNSAGQAAMLFSNYAERVVILVRGKALADSMSRYLIEQILTKSNISLETESEVATVAGGECLTGVSVRHRRTGEMTERSCSGLFVFIGASPMTTWLPDTVIRDQWNYVCTGRDVMDLLATQTNVRWPLERDPYLLETSTPGVFAVGDVRHGSIKRVASAVGEGSMAIAFVHQYLAERRQGVSVT